MSPIRIFLRRPRLLFGIGAGLATGLSLGFLPLHATPVQSALIAWDAGAFVFISLMMIEMRGQTPERMRLRSARQDEGQGLILTLALLAALASIGAVVSEMSAAKNAAGALRFLRVGFAFSTVALSWFMTQLFFALHYAHEYFRSDGSGGHQGGLGFPEGEVPDFWDFLYFSLIIGVACQTADIGFTSKTLRRIGSVHGVTAFLFNTAILALGVNLAAGLF